MLSSGGKPLSSPSLRHQQQLQAMQLSQQYMSRRVPPEVPKRTSSITIRYIMFCVRVFYRFVFSFIHSESSLYSGQPGQNLIGANQHGSMSSVQSSGSDSSSVDHQRTASIVPQRGYDLNAEK
jgi:hypothetical protein